MVFRGSHIQCNQFDVGNTGLREASYLEGKTKPLSHGPPTQPDKTAVSYFPLLD